MQVDLCLPPSWRSRGEVRREVRHWEGQWPVPSRDQPWAFTGIDQGNAQGCQAVHTPALSSALLCDQGHAGDLVLKLNPLKRGGVP